MTVRYLLLTSDQRFINTYLNSAESRMRASQVVLGVMRWEDLRTRWKSGEVEFKDGSFLDIAAPRPSFKPFGREYRGIYAETPIHNSVLLPTLMTAMARGEAFVRPVMAVWELLTRAGVEPVGPNDPPVADLFFRPELAE